jgi:hypothetical protein
MVSTGSPPSVLADVHGAGFVRGDLVVHHVGADEFGDQLAARAGGAHAANLQPVAPQLLHFGQPLLHGLDGPAGGAQVDIVDHGAGIRRWPPRWWKPIRCRGRDTPEWAVARAAGVGAHAVAQLHHVFGGERRVSCTLSSESCWRRR